MMDEEVLVTKTKKAPKEVTPVMFFNRGDPLPAGHKDFRAHVTKSRPTVPPVVNETPVAAADETEPAAEANDAASMWGGPPSNPSQPTLTLVNPEPKPQPQTATARPQRPSPPSKAPVHPSSLPAKD